MPDPIAISRALGCAATVAALLLLVCGWPWRAPSATRLRLGWVLALGGGTYLGCRLLDLWPHWPPREDQDRFLLIVLPAVLLVEIVVAFPRVPARLAWGLRLLIALAAGRILLHGSVYVTDIAGASARLARTQTWITLAALAVGLAVAWAGLDLLMRRRPGVVVPAALMLTLMAASLTVMLSGYATGGQLGLPLAASLAGASLASAVLRRPPPVSALSIPLVGLFGLITIGYFFGELTPVHAVILLAAPLCCWIPELPYVCRLGPKLRVATSVGLVVLAIVLVVARAQRTFATEMSATSDPADDTSEQDYMQLGR